MDIIDSYKQFFEICSKKDFIKFGIGNIITIDRKKASVAWRDLLKRIYTKEPGLYIRNSGRNGSGNAILKKLYLDVFGININFDKTNNNKPTQLIQKLTGHRKNKTIFNYQVSHVFGNTKNVFCFTAPWNIIFIPKILDPLTGHEAKGGFVEEFQKKLRKKITAEFSAEIIEYNKKMKKKAGEISKWVEDNVPEKLKKSIKKDFEPIEV